MYDGEGGGVERDPSRSKKNKNLNGKKDRNRRTSNRLLPISLLLFARGRK